MASKIAPLTDGVLWVCELGDIGAPGEMPKEGLTPKWKLRYDERMVGMNRFWSAQQVAATITRLVRCHRLEQVTSLHVVMIGTEQYTIRQIQYIPDVSPPVMDLSLERRMIKYPVRLQEPEPKEPDETEPDEKEVPDDD